MMPLLEAWGHRASLRESAPGCRRVPALRALCKDASCRCPGVHNLEACYEAAVKHKLHNHHDAFCLMVSVVVLVVSGD